MKYILCSVSLICLLILGGVICIKVLEISGDSLFYFGSATGMIAQRIMLSIFGSKYVFFGEIK